MVAVTKELAYEGLVAASPGQLTDVQRQTQGKYNQKTASGKPAVSYIESAPETESTFDAERGGTVVPLSTVWGGIAGDRKFEPIKMQEIIPSEDGESTIVKDLGEFIPREKEIPEEPQEPPVKEQIQVKPKLDAPVPKINGHEPKRTIDVTLKGEFGEASFPAIDICVSDHLVVVIIDINSAKFCFIPPASNEKKIKLRSGNITSTVYFVGLTFERSDTNEKYILFVKD